MKKILIALLILIVGGGIAYVTLGEKTPVAPSDTEGALTYFMDSLTVGVQTSVEDYDKLGLAGGVDGFNLMKVYPGLVPSDFRNVLAYQGEYSAPENDLVFTGNAASNSGVLTRVGMRTLLNNISKRLGLQNDTKEKVDAIIIKIQSK